MNALNKSKQKRNEGHKMLTLDEVTFKCREAALPGEGGIFHSQQCQNGCRILWHALDGNAYICA